MKSSMIIVILLLILGGGYYLIKGNQTEIAPTPTPTPVTVTQPAEATTSGVGSVKEFTVEETEFSFTPSTITVNQGDTVKITFKNVGKFGHDWQIDDLEVKTEIIKGGETTEISFVADQAGTFEYYCGVGQHKANGMVGKLIVK